MVVNAAAYPWSSPPAYHLLGIEDQPVMADRLHRSAFSYRDFFHEQDGAGDLEAIREAAKQGKAWGKTLFLEKLANELGKVVVPRKRGRPKISNLGVTPFTNGINFCFYLNQNVNGRREFNKENRCGSNLTTENGSL